MRFTSFKKFTQSLSFVLAFLFAVASGKNACAAAPAPVAVDAEAKEEFGTAKPLGRVAAIQILPYDPLKEVADDEVEDALSLREKENNTNKLKRYHADGVDGKRCGKDIIPPDYKTVRFKKYPGEAGDLGSSTASTSGGGGGGSGGGAAEREEGDSASEDGDVHPYGLGRTFVYTTEGSEQFAPDEAKKKYIKGTHGYYLSELKKYWEENFTGKEEAFNSQDRNLLLIRIVLRGSSCKKILGEYLLGVFVSGYDRNAKGGLPLFRIPQDPYKKEVSDVVKNLLSGFEKSKTDKKSKTDRGPKSVPDTFISKDRVKDTIGSSLEEIIKPKLEEIIKTIKEEFEERAQGYNIGGKIYSWNFLGKLLFSGMLEGEKVFRDIMNRRLLDGLTLEKAERFCNQMFDSNFYIADDDRRDCFGSGNSMGSCFNESEQTFLNFLEGFGLTRSILKFDKEIKDLEKQIKSSDERKLEAERNKKALKDDLDKKGFDEKIKDLETQIKSSDKRKLEAERNKKALKDDLDKKGLKAQDHDLHFHTIQAVDEGSYEAKVFLYSIRDICCFCRGTLSHLLDNDELRRMISLALGSEVADLDLYAYSFKKTDRKKKTGRS